MPITNLIDISVVEEQAEVIDLAYVKKYLVISTDSFDSLLNDLIKAARIEVEKLAQISIVEKTIKAEWSEAYEFVNLPNPKINSVISVKDGNDIDVYHTKKGIDKVRIIGDFPSGLKVEYTTGYGSSTPEDLKLAIVKKISEDFEHRTGTSLETNNLLPNNWRVTAINYRPTWLMF